MVTSLTAFYPYRSVRSQARRVGVLRRQPAGCGAA